MEGCGYYSDYTLGSFMLFPTFLLQVDDSTDNIVSLKALGRDYDGHIDYKEPKYKARPAHLIPDDDMQYIKYSILDPKAHPISPPSTSPSPTPTPSPDVVVISDEELTLPVQRTTYQENGSSDT